MKRLLATLIIILLLFNFDYTYANEPNISKSDIIKKAITNSIQIREQKNNITQANYEYNTAMLGSIQYFSYKDLKNRLGELNQLENLTTGEEIEKNKILISLQYCGENIAPETLVHTNTTILNFRNTIESYNYAQQNATNNLIISLNEILIKIENINQSIAAQKTLIANIDNSLAVLKNKLNYGLVAQLEVSQVELKYKIAQVDLNKLNNSLNILYMQLSKTTGERITSSSKVSDNKLESLDDLQPLEYYIDYASKNRKDLKVSYVNSLFRKIDYQRAIQNHGINSVNNEFRQVYISYKNALNSYDDLYLLIKQQIINAHKDNESQLINVESCKNKLEIAEQAYAKTQLEYKQGKITAYELVNANAELTNAQSQYSNAQGNAIIYRLKLNQACGFQLE